MITAQPNWAGVLALADEHALVPQLVALVHCADADLIPLDIREKLCGWEREHSIFTLRLMGELFRLMERFAALQLEFLVTKGPVLAQRCYGDPSLRQYTDVDLILRHRDIHRATVAMRELGYEPRIPLDAIAAEKVPGEYVFRQSRTNLLVEFHTERTLRYHPHPLQLDKIFKRSVSVRLHDREVPALSLEDELVLICIHSAKHLWEQLSWVADVAALISPQPLEWSRLRAAASEVGAERMLRVGLRLAYEIAGGRLPPEIDADVRSDAGAMRLAEQFADRMPLAAAHRIGILQRALLRIRMRGGFALGLPYLLRLSFSPTEEDWRVGAEGKRPWLRDALGRPLRLVRKYGSAAQIKRARIAKSEPS